MPSSRYLIRDHLIMTRIPAQMVWSCRSEQRRLPQAAVLSTIPRQRTLDLTVEHLGFI